MSVLQNTVVLSIALLLWPALVPAAQTSPAKPRDQVLKEKLVEIPMGSIIEVKLDNKKKLRGKLGAVTDGGFELQTVQGGKFSTETLAYQQVRALKYQEKGMSTATKVVLGSLAGVGTLFLVMIGVAAAHGWD